MSGALTKTGDTDIGETVKMGKSNARICENARSEEGAHTGENAATLVLERVTMQFGGVLALDGLSMEIGKGEIVALIGPNGAGKTTAFNCVTGVYEPTNGRALLNGEVIVENRPQGKMKNLYKGADAGMYIKTVSLTPDQITRRGVARTYQNIRLFKNLTVFENVLIAKHMRAKQNLFSAALRLNAKEEKRMRDEAMALLEEQNLAHLSGEAASSLPYGYQRRLEIARALATGPSLLLLDEPAAGMNPQETSELNEYIQRIRREYNLTIFLIEHHMDLVMNISDRIYVLDFGKLIANGTPDQVRNDQRVIDAYLGVAEDMYAGTGGGESVGVGAVAGADAVVGEVENAVGDAGDVYATVANGGEGVGVGVAVGAGSGTVEGAVEGADVVARTVENAVGDAGDVNDA